MLFTNGRTRMFANLDRRTVVIGVVMTTPVTSVAAASFLTQHKRRHRRAGTGGHAAVPAAGQTR